MCPYCYQPMSSNANQVVKKAAGFNNLSDFLAKDPSFEVRGGDGVVMLKDYGKDGKQGMVRAHARRGAPICRGWPRIRWRTERGER